MNASSVLYLRFVCNFHQLFQVYHRNSEFYCSNGEVGQFDAKERIMERKAFYSLLHSTVLQINYTIDGELA